MAMQSETGANYVVPVSGTVTVPAKMPNRSCLLCSAKIRQTLTGIFDTRFGINGTYGVAICDRCGLEQTEPAPTALELKNLYESHYNFGGEKGTLYTNLRERFLSSFLYRWWIFLDGDISFHARLGRGSLLDIGCNEGRGLKIYSRNGFQAEGLELNETAAKVARQAGFTVHTCDLSDFNPAVRYDVVVLSNVLEHSLDPKQMLLDVRRLLKPTGVVWISCPNSRSWLRNLFGRYWIHWHVPFHISHFSAGTLNHLLIQAGFTSIRISNTTPALWVSSSVISRLCATPGKPTKQLRNPVLVLSLLAFSRLLLFPFLWFGNQCNRGDCLLAAATKS
jgi:SAM-dependent methyltransferase